MNDNPYRITFMLIGEPTVGKSAVGNAILQLNAFETRESPDLRDLNLLKVDELKPYENTIDGVTRIVIDTQGLEFTRSFLDEVYQIDYCLRRWNYGVNVIGIVIDGQTPKLVHYVQRLLKYLYDLFSDNNFWNSVCLIFTRWFDGIMTEKAKSSRFEIAEKVRQIARECLGNDDANPEIPCFFVDIKDDLTELDINTRNELGLIYQFGSDKQPLSARDTRFPEIITSNQQISNDKEEPIKEDDFYDKMKDAIIRKDINDLRSLLQGDHPPLDPPNQSILVFTFHQFFYDAIPLLLEAGANPELVVPMPYDETICPLLAACDVCSLTQSGIDFIRAIVSKISGPLLPSPSSDLFGGPAH